MDDVLIVGGGVAGLAAAVELTSRGHRVHVLERRPILGGRASSYTSPGGHVVDNGQHLLMGCYSRTLAFLDRIGSRNRIEVGPRLSVALADAERGVAWFRCGDTPPPFHLGRAALGYRHLNVRDRVALLVGGMRLALGSVGSGETVAAALSRVGQSARSVHAYWSPLTIAVLNEGPERASAALLREVLRRVFLGDGDAARLVFPKVGLSELYAEPAARTIEAAGGIVERNARVEALEIEGGLATGVRLVGGRVVPARTVVLATPPDVIPGLLPPRWRSEGAFAHLGRLEGIPIVSIHLWFRERWPSPRMIGFLDPDLHWFFTPPMQPRTGRYVTLVSSGARRLASADPASVRTMAVDRLERFLPRTRGLSIDDALVTKEREATFAASPAEQDLRPGPSTPIPNLFVAGDWTDTGLPATIESAAESGWRAAAAAAATRGAPRAERHAA